MMLFKPIYLFPLVVLALVMGIAGGWIRLGYMGMAIPGTAAGHGVLMVGGFLGTLISLERAMVMKNRIWLLIPLMSGLSIPALLVLPGWPAFGAGLLLAASLGLMGIMYLQSLRHPVIYQYVMSMGTVLWMAGNFMLLYSGFVPAAVPWWIGFILFTIVGERLELSKFLPTPHYAKNGLLLLLTLFFIGIILPFHQFGSVLMGTAAILISYWLLHFDMAKIASKKEGQFKYIGIGLRVGYVWLTLHGIVLCFFGMHVLYYDLYIHTFFLGFAFSMIWAHAPIILPMVLNIRENPYHLILWIGWTVFQLSLLGRIMFSLLGMPEWRTLFGVINGWTIIGMFVLMAVITLVKMMGSKTGMSEAKSFQ
jgi:hypothetical protein